MPHQVMSARKVMARHPWAAVVLEEQYDPTPPLMAHYPSIIGIMRDGGFSYDLIHHGRYALAAGRRGLSGVVRPPGHR